MITQRRDQQNHPGVVLIVTRPARPAASVGDARRGRPAFFLPWVPVQQPAVIGDDRISKDDHVLAVFFPEGN
jgi:hypothetical protein